MSTSLCAGHVAGDASLSRTSGGSHGDDDRVWNVARRVGNLLILGQQEKNEKELGGKETLDEACGRNDNERGNTCNEEGVTDKEGYALKLEIAAAETIEQKIHDDASVERRGVRVHL